MAKKNNGGDAASAVVQSKIYLTGSTLELYGGSGGKHLVGSGSDGESADAVYSSSIYTDDAAISDGKTGEVIKNKVFSRHQSVIIKSNNATVLIGSILGGGSLIIIAAVLVVVAAAVIILLKRKKKGQITEA